MIHKRSLRIAGHDTSVALEPEFWAALEKLAWKEGLSLSALITRIDKERTGPLASSLRIYALTRFRAGEETQ